MRVGSPAPCISQPGDDPSAALTRRTIPSEPVILVSLRSRRCACRHGMRWRDRSRWFRRMITCLPARRTRSRILFRTRHRIRAVWPTTAPTPFQVARHLIGRAVPVPFVVVKPPFTAVQHHRNRHAAVKVCRCTVIVTVTRIAARIGSIRRRWRWRVSRRIPLLRVTIVRT